MLTLTKEQGLAVGCYTAALLLMYILPATVVVATASAILIGETGAAILCSLTVIKGMSKAYRWCLEAFQ